MKSRPEGAINVTSIKDKNFVKDRSKADTAVILDPEKKLVYGKSSVPPKILTLLDEGLMEEQIEYLNINSKFIGESEKPQAKINYTTFALPLKVDVYKTYALKTIFELWRPLKCESDENNPRGIVISTIGQYNMEYVKKNVWNLYSY